MDPITSPNTTTTAGIVPDHMMRTKMNPIAATTLYVGYTEVCTRHKKPIEEYGFWHKDYEFDVVNVSVTDPRKLPGSCEVSVETIEIPSAVNVGDTVYVLYMTYSDGDSFGTAEGQGEVLYVFKNKQIAEEAHTKWVNACDVGLDEVLNSVCFHKDDRSTLALSNPASGYFSNVGHIDLIELIVE